MFYGLDVHKEFVQVCEVDKSGKKLREFKIKCSREELEKFALSLPKNSQVVLEATFHTWIIYTILKTHLSNVVVANPTQVKAIACARIKTDKIDAHILAQLLRTDFIPKVEMPDEKSWEERQLIHHRRNLTRQENVHKNILRGMLNKKLMICPYTDLCGSVAKVWFKDQKNSFTQIELIIVESTYRQLDEVTESIKRVDEQLVYLVANDHNAKLLMTIPGVSFATAIGFLSTIGDIQRFETPEKLAAYFGLVPSISQSANRSRSGGITKTGRSIARWLAVQSAQKLSRSDTPIAATYHRVKQKKGHNVAVVAMARKLVVLMWHMLKNKEPFRQAPINSTRRKLAQVNPVAAQTKKGYAAKTVDELFKKFGLPECRTQKKADKRVSTINLRKVRSIKRGREVEQI